MWSAEELAKYIVTKCTEDHFSVSNLQLQGILYFIQKEALRQTGKPMFRDEIQAWKFGPAIPAVYYRFGGFGAMPIDAVYATRRPEGLEKSLIHKIMEEKRALAPWELYRETHRKDGAWETVFADGTGNGREIPLRLLAAEP